MVLKETHVCIEAKIVLLTANFSQNFHGKIWNAHICVYRCPQAATQTQAKNGYDPV